MSTTRQLDALRSQIRELKQSGRTVHVTISNTHPKISLIDLPVIIQYASSQIFWIERVDKKSLFCNSFQYADLLTGRVEIQELKDLKCLP